MSVRLTKKKQKEILKRIDQIIMRHRAKIYVALGGHSPVKIDRKTSDEVRSLLGYMNHQLVMEIIPMIDEVVKHEPPILPLT